MRHIFVILMIALLPLRSWAGDLMAVDMATQHINAISFIANSAYEVGTTGTFDKNQAADPGSECPGHVATASSPISVVNAADTTADGHCSTCGVCQICHVVALAPTTVRLAPTFISSTVAPFGGTRFTSALSALGLKPPIS